MNDGKRLQSERQRAKLSPAPHCAAPGSFALFVLFSIFGLKLAGRLISSSLRRTASSSVMVLNRFRPGA